MTFFIFLIKNLKEGPEKLIIIFGANWSLSLLNLDSATVVHMIYRS